jgi:hypothetical protein
MMPFRSLLLGAACVALLGCGKSEPPRPALPAKAAAVHKPGATPSDGLPTPHCPAKADGSLGGPDVVGLKLGMARADALDHARCLLKDTFVSFEGNWIQGLRSYGVKLAPQVFVAHVGENRPCKYNPIDETSRCDASGRAWAFLAEKITVVSPGVPGGEKVLGIWREQHFKPGDMPTAEALATALVQKYGAPQIRQQHVNNWLRLDWLRDPAGATIEQGQRGPSCRSIAPRGNESHSWSDACGLTITALIVLNSENPQIASELNVGMVNQRELYRAGAALQAQLEAMEQQRRQQEVEQSKSVNSNVKL